MTRSDALKRWLDKISEWSLYLLILALPFAKSIIEITIVTALVALLLRKAIAGEKLLKDGADSADILLFVFLGLSLLSFVNTSDVQLSLRAFFSKSVKFAVLFLMAREIIDSDKKFRNFSFMAVLSCALIVIDGFIQQFITHVDVLHNYPAFKYVAAQPFNRTFPTASFPFPNDFAAWILVFIFPVGMCAVFVRQRVIKRAALIALFFSLGYLLVLTRVRGALLGFVTALILLSFFRLKKIFIVAAAGLLIAGFLINRPIIEDVMSRASISDRSTMWTTSWKIYKAHPVIGGGINTFFANYANARTDDLKGLRGSYAHNCYLQMAAEVGGIGLAAFLAFIASLCVAVFSSLRVIREHFYYSVILGGGLGLIAFLVHSFFDTNLYSLNLAALFWIFAGILLSAVKIAKTG